MFNKPTLKEISELGSTKSLILVSPQYVSYREKLEWKRVCGHTDLKSYDYVKNNFSDFCEKCWCNKKIQECTKKALTKGGDFLSQEFMNINNKLKWKCSLGHVWLASYRSVIRGKHWCPKCQSLRMTTNNPGQNEIVKLKIKNTWNKKYNGHPIFDNDIAIKQAKKINNPYILYHWKTNEELVCQGSWEKKVVEFLNKNKIEYSWQSKIFHLPDNQRTYRPDVCLVNENKWVEIKGYFRKDAKEKWDWFHKEHPNSELWDKAKLRRMNIL